MAWTWWRQFLLPTAGCQCFPCSASFDWCAPLGRDSSGHPVPPGGEGRRWSRVVDRKHERLDMMRRNNIVLLEFTALTKIRVILIVFSRPPSARQSTLLSVSPRVAQCAQPDGRRWFGGINPLKEALKCTRVCLRYFPLLREGGGHTPPLSRAPRLSPLHQPPSPLPPNICLHHSNWIKALWRRR